MLHPHRTFSAALLLLPACLQTLYDAIDTVGSFSLLHPQWFDIVNSSSPDSGVYVPVPPLGQIQWDKPFRKY